MEKLTDQEIIQNELIRRGFFDTAETFARQCLQPKNDQDQSKDQDTGHEQYNTSAK